VQKSTERPILLQVIVLNDKSTKIAVLENIRISRDTDSFPHKNSIFAEMLIEINMSISQYLQRAA
jgi:hypothetical protein